MGNAASNIPYNVAGNVPSYTGKQGWTLHTGTKKENSEPVSIFKLKKDGLSNSRLEACTNALNRVKTIRHPNTLTYLEGVETDKEVLIVTEPVTPLQDWLQSAKETNSDEQYEAAIAWCSYTGKKDKLAMATGCWPDITAKGLRSQPPALAAPPRPALPRHSGAMLRAGARQLRLSAQCRCSVAPLLTQANPLSSAADALPLWTTI